MPTPLPSTSRPAFGITDDGDRLIYAPARRPQDEHGEGRGSGMVVAILLAAVSGGFVACVIRLLVGAA
ncbi:hypothetical protein [Methylobacterium oryzisoli]|uniref:hypothetical protein n=1 Tax=Methylobacterium oryzisoli TaxID=3385502 RepID=UPI0038911BB8